MMGDLNAPARRIGVVRKVLPRISSVHHRLRLARIFFTWEKRPGSRISASAKAGEAGAKRPAKPRNAL
jgi:hypothetical protein